MMAQLTGSGGSRRAGEEQLLIENSIKLRSVFRIEGGLYLIDVILNRSVGLSVLDHFLNTPEHVEEYWKAFYKSKKITHYTLGFEPKSLLISSMIDPKL